jgi:hypothetical protein
MASYAADFSKNGSTFLQVQGSTAKYSLSSLPGAVQFPNSQWEILGGSVSRDISVPITKTIPVQLPAGGNLPSVPVKVQTKVPYKSLSKLIINPWTFLANAAISTAIQAALNEACLRLVGGQMVNNNGVWEECVKTPTKLLPELYYSNYSSPVGGDWVYDKNPTVVCQKLFPTGTVFTNFYQFGAVAVPKDSGTGCQFSRYNYATPSNVSTEVRGPLFEIYFCGSNYVPTKDTECGEAMDVKWRDIAPEQAENKLAQNMGKLPGITDTIFNELYNQGQTFENVDPVTVSGPASIPAGDPVTTTKTNPDGSTSTSQDQYYRNYSYNGDTVTHTSTTINNNTNNSNSSNNTSTNTTTITTIPSNSQANQNIEISMCGLPGKPPCKIDESGTPEAGQDNSSELVTNLFKPVTQCFENISSCLPAFPELSWAFTVPAACVLIPVAGFAPYIESIDLCKYQSLFHDLMSLLWVGAGLFAASSMLFRDSQGA